MIKEDEFTYIKKVSVNLQTLQKISKLSQHKFIMLLVDSCLDLKYSSAYNIFKGKQSYNLRVYCDMANACQISLNRLMFGVI